MAVMNLEMVFRVAIAAQAAAANAWFAQMRESGPPPSPNLGVVMGPDFAQLAANLGRNLVEGRFGILTAVFEAASIDT